VSMIDVLPRSTTAARSSRPPSGYCEQEEITSLARSPAGRKKDGAYVGHKNLSVVRRGWLPPQRHPSRAEPGQSGLGPAATAVELVLTPAEVRLKAP